MKIMLIFQSSNWFKENSFEDTDGCFWKTKTLRDDFEISKIFDFHLTEVDVYSAICKELQGDYVIIDSDDFKDDIYQDKIWGIKKVVNSNDHPEYFV